jgi:hypothetical protein
MENSVQTVTINFEKDGQTYAFVIPNSITYGQAIDAAIMLVEGLGNLAKKSATDIANRGVIDASPEQS